MFEIQFIPPYDTYIQNVIRSAYKTAPIIAEEENILIIWRSEHSVEKYITTGYNVFTSSKNCVLFIGNPSKKITCFIFFSSLIGQHEMHLFILAQCAHTAFVLLNEFHSIAYRVYTVRSETICESWIICSTSILHLMIDKNKEEEEEERIRITWNKSKKALVVFTV